MMLRFLLTFLVFLNAISSFADGRILSHALDTRDSALQINQPAQLTAAGRPAFNLSHTNFTSGSYTSPTIYPVDCFTPGEAELQIAVAEDCEFIINDMIPRIPNPLQEQTWGFDDSADINLNSPEYKNWNHGQCVVKVDSTITTEEDTFRPVDVAIQAQRIVQRCVVGSKTAIGGTVSIGSPSKNFYLLLGGIRPIPTRTPLALPSSSCPDCSATSKDTEKRDLSKRLTNPFSLIQSSDFNVPLTCIKPGMPSESGKLSIDACNEAAKFVLQEPNILNLKSFTTEPTGGIHIPFTRYAEGCYFQVNTNTPLSSSQSYSLLQIVYYASEVLRKCPLGGVAKLGGGSGFFVSVTGIDPSPDELGLANLVNNVTLGIGIQ